MTKSYVLNYILFSGPDGSGKTTLSYLLKIHFSSRGFRVRYHWLRGSHLFASLLARFLPLFNVFSGVDNPYYSLRIPSSFRIIWLFIEFISFIPVYILRRILAIFYNILVCDRGLLDFISWVISTTRYPGFLTTLYGRFLIRLHTKESIIYVYASPDILLRRADVPKDFLMREYTIYNVLKKYSNVSFSIDTSYDTPIKSLAKIINCLRMKYGFD